MVMISSFFISMIFLPLEIKWLKRMQIGQFIREEGPATHLTKKGTPTMGGLLFIFLPILFTIIFSVFKGFNKDMFWFLYVIIAFSLIGFLDDYRKTVQKSSYGLKAREDLFLQILFSIPFILYIYSLHPDKMPFFIFFGFELFVILAITNSVNLTDGLDGLLTGITILILLFYILFSYFITKTPINPNILVIEGCLLAFLFFNFYPAKVFMGNVGSFCLGGVIAYFVLITQTEWFLPLLGFIFVAEALSDIIQVSYFRYTKRKTGIGKRIFRMAPLHHHFELMGIPEPTIVIRFWILQTILTVSALLLYYNRSL